MDEWITENPKIDSDHHRLESMLAAVRALLAERIEPQVLADATLMLRERMSQHFRMEEAVAGRADAETQAILQSDHLDLTALLDQIAAAGAMGDHDEVIRMLDLFRHASARHETEVDVPLFHLLATQNLMRNRA